jgi:hypothetical protein
MVLMRASIPTTVQPTGGEFNRYVVITGAVSAALTVGLAGLLVLGEEVVRWVF